MMNITGIKRSTHCLCGEGGATMSHYIFQIVLTIWRQLHTVDSSDSV